MLLFTNKMLGKSLLLAFLFCNTAFCEDKLTKIKTDYLIYVGEVKDYEQFDDYGNVEWKWRKLLGNGKREIADFDLDSVTPNSILDIEIVNKGTGYIYVDALENLQNETYLSDKQGFYIQGSQKWENIFGKPDSVSSEIRYNLILRFPIWAGAGKDLRIYTTTPLSITQLNNITKPELKQQISMQDKTAIDKILNDFKQAYENKNKELILQHVADTLYQTYNSELEVIFSRYRCITIMWIGYNIVGDASYAMIEPIKSHSPSYKVISDNIQGACDACTIFFKKENNIWEIISIGKYFNPHADLLLQKR